MLMVIIVLVHFFSFLCFKPKVVDFWFLSEYVWHFLAAGTFRISRWVHLAPHWLNFEGGRGRRYETRPLTSCDTWHPLLSPDIYVTNGKNLSHHISKFLPHLHEQLVNCRWSTLSFSSGRLNSDQRSQSLLRCSLVNQEKVGHPNIDDTNGTDGTIFQKHMRTIIPAIGFFPFSMKRKFVTFDSSLHVCIVIGLN